MNKMEKEELKLKRDFGVLSFLDVEKELFECRNKNKIPQNAKSILFFVFPYKVKEEKPKNICRYASVCDYHTAVGGILESISKELKNKFPDFSFVPFVDNSPINEVKFAASSGLGVIGKNGLLITKEYGSFVFIGEIVTDLLITPTKTEIKGCLNCFKCKENCPVGLDKEKCLSKITQKKGELTQEEEELIRKSGCIWGCDICSDVCPMNKGAKTTDIKEFTESYKNEYIFGEDITDRAFMWRGEKVIKRNYKIINP